MLPATTRRVPANTASHVNDQIRREAAARLTYYAKHPDEIGTRLRELDREWDIERTLETNAALLALGGTLLGLTTGKRGWFALPLAVAGFLFQHAIQGWCPPLPVLRRLGYRTATEIEDERYALRLLRGDVTEADNDAQIDDRGNDPDRLQAALRALDG
jgi:hypothetical protein